MTDTEKQSTPAKEDIANAPTKQVPGATATPTRERGHRQGPGGRDRRQRRDRPQRQRSEHESKILDIRRVTRVVAGGRRFSFSVTLVIGNGKGQVGVGIGKASDTALAIEKATKNAKKHLINVHLTDDLSIPHEVEAKYNASEVLLIPTPGRGFKAGSATRAVLELAGVKHVSAKILSRSKNQLNNARATIMALKNLKPIYSKMHKRMEGKKPQTSAKPNKHTQTKKNDGK